MTTHARQIRPLTPQEVGETVEWAAREGWNPGLDDVGSFLAHDPGGFYGLFADGDLCVTLSGMPYGPEFGFVGFYICRPDRRGEGLGLALWTAVLGGMTARTLGLDGVVAQQENYKRSGFALVHRNIRYGGAPVALGGSPAGIVPVEAAHGAGVAACDRRHFLFQRPAFLARWLALPRGRAFAAIVDGEVEGYCVVRRCRSGHRIGPLYAPDPATARALYSAAAGHAAAAAPGEPIFLDVPEPNSNARSLAEDAGLAPVFETARMYRGAAPALPLERIYGITSLELG